MDIDQITQALEAINNLFLQLGPLLQQLGINDSLLIAMSLLILLSILGLTVLLWAVNKLLFQAIRSYRLLKSTKR